jgi:hypothetical protein
MLYRWMGDARLSKRALGGEGQQRAALAGGVYLVRMRAGDFVGMRKVQLLRPPG